MTHDTKAAEPALPQVQQALDRLDNVIRFLRSGHVASDARMMSVTDLEALRDHIAALSASTQAPAGVQEALDTARQFIRNGVALGYIRMPDPEVPDPAHDTLPKIEAALAALKARQGPASPAVERDALRIEIERVLDLPRGTSGRIILELRDEDRLRAALANQAPGEPPCA